MMRLNPRAQVLFRSLWLWPCLLTAGLYWRALSLPFFWDDVPQFVTVVPHTLWEIWTNQTSYAYYRPALFTFYKITYDLLHLPPPCFFAVAIGLHALNAVLVGRLTRWAAQYQGARRPMVADLAALIAALYFAAYPFAVMPIANIACIQHLIVIALALGAVLAALRFTRVLARRWLGLAIVLAASAPYFHETGIVVAPIVALTLVLYNARAAWRRRSLLVLLFAADALFPLLWAIVPKQRTPVFWVGWASVFSSLTFFVQSLTYPFQPLATWLIQRTHGWDLGVIWLVALPPLALAAALLWHDRRRRTLGLALGWFVLIISPSVLLLPFDYVYPSIRLHYVVGPAATVLWAWVCVSLAERLPRPAIRPLVAVGVSLLVLVPNMVFITSELTLHELALRPVWQLAAIARAFPKERHLLVNPLDWVAYRQAWYPLGHEGVEVMPVYVGPTELAQINAGIRTRIESAVLPAVQTVMDRHYYGVHGENQALDEGALAALATAYDRVWLTIYSDQQIRVVEAGSAKPDQTGAPADYLANFEDKLVLTRATFDVRGSESVVTLNWRYLGPDLDATIFRHLFTCAGKSVGMGDGVALERLAPFGYLPPHTALRDVRHILLTATAADGCYYLEIGLFRADGARLKAFAPDGSEFENGIITIQ